jgi:glucose-1-phosphate cytidylyltransferase
MDTFREYKVLNDLWDSGQAPWRIWREGREAAAA